MLCIQKAPDVVNPGGWMGRQGTRILLWFNRAGKSRSWISRLFPGDPMCFSEGCLVDVGLPGNIHLEQKALRSERV